MSEINDDTKRLDALERYSLAYTRPGCYEKVAECEVFEPEDDEEEENPDREFTVQGPKTRFGSRQGRGKTLREAIDKAMAWEAAPNLHDVNSYFPATDELPNV